MKKTALFLFLLSFVLGLNAQTAREEIYADIHRSASNYYAYPGPGDAKQTPAPIGYKPCYISTYARHGSRFLTSEEHYYKPFQVLHDASVLGKLTPLGQQTLAAIESMMRMSQGRIGELTPLGARQHTDIARRMFHNFPEVFQGEATVDARSTVVIRCILSMLNECQQLKAMNPQLRVNTDASMHDMYYLNYDDKEISKWRQQPEVKAAIANFNSVHIHPERLMRALFSDQNYVQQHLEPQKLMKQLFDIAANVQSHKGQTDLDLYGIFTKEECYDLWLVDNYSWNVGYGSSSLTHHKMPYLEVNLLENILQTADSCLREKDPGATLRFGHEVCLLPLAALLELGDCGKSADNPEQLADSWRNYKIFPMGSNIQLVFFRQPRNKDVLVKALLNEQEVTLPVASDLAPYYHWKDLEAYYRAKLTSFRSQKN